MSREGGEGEKGEREWKEEGWGGEGGRMKGTRGMRKWPGQCVRFSSCTHSLCVQLTGLVLSSNRNILITSMPALLMSVLVIACH